MKQKTATIKMNHDGTGKIIVEENSASVMGFAGSLIGGLLLGTAITATVASMTTLMAVSLAAGIIAIIIGAILALLFSFPFFLSTVISDYVNGEVGLVTIIITAIFVFLFIYLMRCIYVVVKKKTMRSKRYLLLGTIVTTIAGSSTELLRLDTLTLPSFLQTLLIVALFGFSLTCLPAFILCFVEHLATKKLRGDDEWFITKISKLVSRVFIGTHKA